jgi:hypothetical protein
VRGLRETTEGGLQGGTSGLQSSIKTSLSGPGHRQAGKEALAKAGILYKVCSSAGCGTSVTQFPLPHLELPLALVSSDDGGKMPWALSPGQTLFVILDCVLVGDLEGLRAVECSRDPLLLDAVLRVL